MDQEKKRLLLKDTTYYSLANYISQLIGVVNSIALRRFMGPSAMGIWSILQVILGYTSYASFGTSGAMARNYPFLRGKGEHASADKLKNMVFSFSLTMSWFPALMLAGYLLIQRSQLDAGLMAGLIFIMLFLFVRRFYDLLLTLLRSDKQFTLLSQVVVLNALGGLAITFTLVLPWNLYGLLAGTALVTFVEIVYIFRKHHYHFRFYWNNKELRQELKLGIPLVLGGFLGEFLRSMDKWIIAHEFGFAAVGLYSIAMMASTYVYSFPTKFAQIWYPDLVHEYGRSGNVGAIRNYLLTPVFVFTILCPFLCGLAIFVVSLVTHWFLPKFIPGLEAMKVYLIGTFFFLLCQFSYNFLITLNRVLANFPFVLAGIVVNFVLNILFVRMGWGLWGVALGSSISFMIYGLGVYTCALKEFLSPREIVLRIFQMIVTLAYFFTAANLLDHYFQGEDLLLETVYKIFGFILLSSPFFLHLERRTKIVRHFLSMALASLGKRIVKGAGPHQTAPFVDRQ